MAIHPGDQINRAEYLATYVINTKQSTFLRILFKTFPESWIQIWRIMIVPSGHKDFGVYYVQSRHVCQW